MRVDSVEVESLGAGGGSLAQVRYGKVLQAGPQSAGAVPGPACYMRGGERPTLTDALVQLRHLNPRALLQGEMTIDAELSAEAIRREVAGPLGMSEDDAALGILRVLVANIVSSMRTITIERGFNPADFVLAPFGGMGPTLATVGGLLPSVSAGSWCPRIRATSAPSECCCRICARTLSPRSVVGAGRGSHAGGARWRR